MVRRRKNRWAPSLDEVQSYEHANDTRFGDLVDEIHDDPLGRGRVRPTSPLMARPAPVNQDQADADASSLMGNAQAKDVDVTIGPAKITRRGRAASPLAPAPEVPAAAAPAPIEAQTNKPELADPYSEDADARPDFGRVEAGTIEAGTAGDAPPRGDKWLAAARGVGSVLMSAGGRAEEGMQAGLDARRDYMAEEGKHRDWTERNANLARDAAKEQRGENRYAQDTNYGRARDEDSTLRAGQRDRFERDRASAADARAEGDRAYDRDPARRAEALTDYEAKKRLDLKYRPGRGTGAGRKNNVAQFDAARQRLIAIRGGEANLTDEDRAAINYAANDLKDPSGTLNAYAKETEGQNRQDGAAAQRGAANEAKAAAAAAQAEGSIKELQELRESVVRRINAGSNTLPDTFPGEGAARAVTGAAKQALSGVGFSTFDPRPQRAEGESDADYNARLGEYKRTELGPTGYSQDEATINSFGRIMGRSNYNTSTDNSANLASEQKVADEWARSNSTPQAMLDRIDAQIAAEQAAVKSGTHRAVRGALEPEQQAIPPIPPGFEPF